MNIVIQPSGMECLNVGDQAMLEVAYERIRNLWPEARVSVFTSAPDRIRESLPGAIPLSPRFRERYLEHKIFGRLSSRLHTFARLDQFAREHAPRPEAFVADLKLRMRGEQDAVKSLATLKSADVFVVSGGGMINDAFAAAAIDCLTTLDKARRFGARTAILGAMFGPVENRDLKAVCCRVLPRVDFIGVRERLTSIPFLRQCGVNVSRVEIGGDDAVEFAHRNRISGKPRAALGVNARIADYSGLDHDRAGILADAFRALSERLGAPIEPLPLGYHDFDDDRAALRAMFGEQNGQACAAHGETPAFLIERIGSCRLVVSGSYHAAVFALAQGIPALGLVWAPYYEAKFRGLADLFGAGCRYVDGRKPRWERELKTIAADLWHTAADWEQELVAAARKQIVAGKAAYETFAALVSKS